MKTILPYLTVLVLTMGCTHTVPHKSPSDPIVAHPAPKFAQKPAAYESAAWHLFARADYVRALQFAYRATEHHPQEPSAALLVGLIYDHGFKRPDLALSAYNHILQQAAHYEGVEIIQPRLPYLFRRTQERVAQISLHKTHTPPLQGAPLAFFPILPWTPNKVQAALGLGLSDILFSNFLDTADSSLPSLRTHMLAHAFLESFPDADAQSFAQWAGADLTLSGTFIQNQNHQVSIRLALLNAQGHPVQKFAPIVGHLHDLESLQQDIHETLSQALNTTAPHPPQASALALTLHGQALDAYLLGDPERARSFAEGATTLAPNTARMNQLKKWIEADHAGSKIGSDLVALYKSLKRQPDPNEATIRRILATQQLLTPHSGLDSATEPLTPFKPPQTEP